MQHKEREMPATVRKFRLLGPDDQVLHECCDNHQTQVTVDLAHECVTDELRVELDHPSEDVPASLFEVQCFSSIPLK